MKRHLLWVALALLATPVAPAMGQTPDGPQIRARGGLGGAGVELLLEQREQLELTADQLTRLERIRAELERTNAPLLAQLGDSAGPRGPGFGRGAPGVERPDSAQREAMREARDGLEPVMRELRENNQAAMEEALAVLTAEQREEARTLLAPGRGGPAGRRGPGGPGRPGGARPPGADQAPI